MGQVGGAGTQIAPVERAIAEGISAGVGVQSAGGHFIIRVVSSAFEGTSLLKMKRLAMSALCRFIKRDDAPVHPIDVLETRICA